ncbi:MAG: GntR family transcriptional regulator, partial [Spirochaetota bacterium]
MANNNTTNSFVDKNSYIPRYKQIKGIILKKIQEGLWPEGSKIPSERDLTRMYQVSRITINKALAELVAEGWLSSGRGRRTFVSGRTRRETGSRIISILSPYKQSELDIFSVFFLETVESIRKQIEGVYDLVVYSSEENPEREKALLEKIADDKIAGVIVFPLVNEKNEAVNLHGYNTLLERSIPIVFIYRQPVNLKISSVSYDVRAIFEIVLEHMAGLSHIGYLGHSSDAYIDRIRLKYFTEVMENFGKPVENELIKLYHTHIEREEVIHEIEEITDQYMQLSGLDGLICHDEIIAFIIRKCFQKRGRGNIEIIGINNYKKHLKNYLHLFDINDFMHYLSV